MRAHPLKTGLIAAAAVLALVLLLFPRAAGAKEQAPRQISAQATKIQAKAEKLDVNSDGWLDEDETAKGRSSLGFLYEAVHARVDINGDGRVSVQEYTQSQIQALHDADRNKDGWIDAEEAGDQKRKLIGELLRGP